MDGITVCFEEGLRNAVPKAYGLSHAGDGHDGWAPEDDEYDEWTDGEQQSDLNTLDPLASYLREIGTMPLLRKSGEVILAKRLEQGREDAARAIFSLPLAVDRLLLAADLVRDGKKPLAAFIRLAGNDDEVRRDEEDRFFAVCGKLSALLQGAKTASHGMGRGARRQCRTGVRQDASACGTPGDIVVNVLSLRPKFDFVESIYAELEGQAAALGNLRAAGRRKDYSAALRRFEGDVGVPYNHALALLRQFEAARAEVCFARQELIQSNLRLVVNAARKYAAMGRMSFPDLIQEGNIGLMRAVDMFDHTMGFKLSTYAMCWIKQSITRALSNHSRMIRLPAHAADEVGKITRAAKQLEQKMGSEPSHEDIAAIVRMPAERVNELMSMAREPLSLTLPVGKDDTTLGDFVQDRSTPSPLEMIIREDLQTKIASALEHLDPKERQVVMGRFSIGQEPKTLAVLADELGLTRERIRQIEMNGIKKLRRFLSGAGMEMQAA